MAWYVGTDSSNFICHYGIKGQKWGIRRFQNPDGSLTEEGKERYSNKNFYQSNKSLSSGYRRIKKLYGDSDEVHSAYRKLNDKFKQDIKEILKDAKSIDSKGLKYHNLASKTKDRALRKSYGKMADEYAKLAFAVPAVDADEYINGIPEKDRDLARSFAFELIESDW